MCRRILVLFDLALQIGIDEIIYFTVHYLIHVAFFVIGPVILDHGIRTEDIASDLGTPFNGFLFSLDGSHLTFLLFDIALIQLALEHVHGLFLVLDLASF